jgi:hypothetical protein
MRAILIVSANENPHSLASRNIYILLENAQASSKVKILN